jgi:hypothetical protein
MPTNPEAATVPSLVDSLTEYLDDLPEEARPDALHEVFYGFYTRLAIIDRATHDLAIAAKEEPETLEGIPSTLAEALRDNTVFVGQELFASRVRTMRAMGYVSSKLSELLDGKPPERPFKLRRAVAFDQVEGRMRVYDLGLVGEHPDLPYDALRYDPAAD